MPWDERKPSMWQIVFPQMANWLPEDERDQLRFEFAQEMERLKESGPTHRLWPPPLQALF